jgi:hypothetical protein
MKGTNILRAKIMKPTKRIAAAVSVQNFSPTTSAKTFMGINISKNKR